MKQVVKHYLAVELTDAGNQDGSFCCGNVGSQSTGANTCETKTRIGYDLRSRISPLSIVPSMLATHPSIE